MWKQNRVDLSTPCVVLIFARSPPARQGKDEQRLRYEVNPLFGHTTFSPCFIFFVAEREGFVQLVAPWQTCLRVAVVCLRRYLYLQNAESKNKFLPLHFLNPTIFDCNSPTSVYSRLLPPVESPFSAKSKRSKEMSKNFGIFLFL